MHRDNNKDGIGLVDVAIWVIVFVLVRCCSASAEDRRAVHQEHALTLSRVVVAEAGYNPGQETWAILHVLEWRRTHLPALLGLSLTEMAARYSTAFNGRSTSDWARQCRHLTTAQLPDVVEAQVDRWLAGARPPSPCPGSTDWASPEYVARQGITPIQCTVHTQNAFIRRDQ